MRHVVFRTRLVVFGALLAAMLPSLVAAQYVADIPRVPFTTDDAGIRVAVVQPDGKIVIGGLFTAVQGEVREGIARLDADGTLDRTFDPRCRGLRTSIDQRHCFVERIVLGPDGAIYFAGDFETVGGLPRAGLAKLTASGTVDTQWRPLPGETAQTIDIGGIAIAGNGLVVSVLNSSADAIRKFDLGGAGAPAAGFTPIPGGFGLIGAGSNEVFALGSEVRRVDAVSGAFVPGWSYERTNPSFTVSPVYDPVSDALFIGDRDGATTATNVRKLRRAGNPVLDTTWAPAITDAYGATVGPGGQLYLEDLTSSSTMDIVRIATTGNGAAEARIAAPTSQSPLRAVDASGRLLLDRSNDLPPQWTPDGSVFGRLSAAGTIDAAFRSGVFRFALITSVATGADGSIIVAGAFDRAGGSPRRGLARLAPDFTLDATWAPQPSGTPTVVAVDAAGDVYAAIGSSPDQLRKFSGQGAGALVSAWNPTGAFGGTSGGIYALIVDEGNSRLYAGGGFGTGGCGASTRRLVRVTLGPGCVADAWSFEPNARVRDIALHTDGFAYIAGTFATIGGTTVDGLARIAIAGTGALDTTWTWSPAASTTVNPFAVVPTPAGLVVAGGFSSVDGLARDGLARLSYANADADIAWVPSADPVRHVVALVDGGDGFGYVAQLPTVDPGSTTSTSTVTRIDLATGANDPAWAPVEADRHVDGLHMTGDGLVIVYGEQVYLDGVGTGTFAVLAAGATEIFADGFE